jgi:outer membrane protein
MTTRFILITTFLGLLNCISANAQETTKMLTFSDAVKIALENNINLKQTENNLIADQSSKTTSLGNMAPSVNINGNAGRRDGNSFNQNEGRVVNGQLDFVNGSLNANMVLYNGLSQFNSVRQNSAQVDARMYQIKRTKQDVIRNVANQYLQCLLDLEFLKISEQNLEVQKKQLEQIAAQVAAGASARVNEFNQDYQVKNAELTRLRSEITLRNDKTTLSGILQIDPASNFDIQNPNIQLNVTGLEDYSIDELFSVASESRSDLLQTEKLELVSEYQFKSNQGNYHPTLSAFFQYGSAYNQLVGTPTSASRNFDQQFRSDNVQKTYGLTLSIPVFNGFSQRNQTVRSRVNYENAKLNTENTRLTVKSNVITAYNSYRDATLNYQASKSQLEAAQLSFDLESERYRLGASDLVSYTQASRNFINAQATFAQSKYTLIFQNILLQYATGALKVEDIP